MSTSNYKYDVFLSFRGPDTRYGFADVLYHSMKDAGIKVFRDDNELDIGDRIDQILLDLDDSRICVPIFSQRFAESSWCLREVERMVTSGNKIIVPIFYHVETDDLKLKPQGQYADALLKHEKNEKHGKVRVEKWRAALKAILGFKGRKLGNEGYKGFAENFTEDILQKLKVKVKKKYEIKNLVEIPDQVERALEFLDINKPDDGPRFLGIHGMGGIGKTVLAKIIFNRISGNFGRSGFLENIRAEKLGSEGVQKLQKQLLGDLHPTLQNVGQNVDLKLMLERIFIIKKVLVVLDDVDDCESIPIMMNNLIGDASLISSGCRIIITTRDTRVVKKMEDALSRCHGDFKLMEMEEMGSEAAVKVLCKHAFGQDSPPPEYKDHASNVVAAVGHLPLALQSVGSSLNVHPMKKKNWTKAEKLLKEKPDPVVQGKLKSSYEALDAQQREIFLDIACFFADKEKTNPCYMWDACGFQPENGIQVLIDMSLLKIKNKKDFWMHDQVRKFGWAIAKEHFQDDRESSRWWMREEADDEDPLKGKMGKDKVEAMCLYPSSDATSRSSLNLEDVVSLMKRLRFLHLRQGADFDGYFRGCGVLKLRWFSSTRLKISSSNPSSIFFGLQDLVILCLHGSDVDKSWQGWRQILVSKKIKVLDLTECYGLTTTPDYLDEAVNLERLILRNCIFLVSVSASIGCLRKLKHLDLAYCERLSWLPQEIASLESLKYLDITKENLFSVYMKPTVVLDGFHRLLKLRYLTLKGLRQLEVLPDSLGKLKLLVTLDLSGTAITLLPSTIGQLVKLKILDLTCCDMLTSLPDSLGDLNSLEELKLEHTRIMELPGSLVKLRMLKGLYLSHTSIKEVSDALEEYLSSLEYLSLPDALEGFGILGKMHKGERSGM